VLEEINNLSQVINDSLLITARSFETGLHFSGLMGTSRLMLKRGSASVGQQRPVYGSG
jgi:hypothetical protein